MMKCKKCITILTIIFLIHIATLGVQGQVPRLDGRIIGGVDVNISNFPYQVSLRYNGAHSCGGSIFHKYYILTAAHCLGRLVSGYSIKVGSAYRQIGGAVKRVCQYFVHEHYDIETMDNDIGILELCEPLDFADEILPVYLPEKREVLRDGTDAKVSGWGYTSENGQPSMTLKAIELPIMSRRRCKELYKDYGISENMICAGYEIGGTDACQGDSGGPLLADGKLYGLVSWGIGCALRGKPGVYTYVPNYRTWIRKITNY